MKINFVNFGLIVFTMSSLMLALFLAGQIFGYEDGIRAILFPRGYPNFENSRLAITQPPGSAVTFFGAAYLIISAIFSALLLMWKVIWKFEPKLSRFLFSGVMLGVVLVAYAIIIRYKYEYLYENDVLVYASWIRNSIWLDWSGLTLAALLLISLIFFIFVSLRTKNRPT